MTIKREKEGFEEKFYQTTCDKNQLDKNLNLALE